MSLLPIARPRRSKVNKVLRKQNPQLLCGLIQTQFIFVSNHPKFLSYILLKATHQIRSEFSYYRDFLTDLFQPHSSHNDSKASFPHRPVLLKYRHSPLEVDVVEPKFFDHYVTMEHIVTLIDQRTVFRALRRGPVRGALEPDAIYPKRLNRGLLDFSAAQADCINA